MKGKLARLISLLMTLCMLLTMSVGFAEVIPEDDNVNTPGILPIVKEPITLTVAITSNNAVEDWATNTMTRILEEDTGIHLEFTQIPSDEFVTKIDLMMLSDDKLPDIIIHNGFGGQANIVAWGQEGKIIPVNEFYERYAYFTNETLKNTVITKEDFLKYITSYDGNIYGVGRLAENLNNMYSGSRIQLYTPWLDELGVEMPDTTDEFLELLRTVKETDLNENGIADEVPLMASKDQIGCLRKFLMTPFVYTQDNYWTVEDGEIGVAFNTEGWKEGLHYIKTMFDEGLIDSVSLTQEQSAMTAALSAEETTVFAYARFSNSNMSAADMRRYQYLRLLALEGPEGERVAVKSPNIPSIGMIITTSCEYPEAAFMLGDYLCSDKMSIMSRYGVEGEDWHSPGEGDPSSPYEKGGYATTIIFTSTWGPLQNTWWGQTGPSLLSMKWTAGQVQAATSSGDELSKASIAANINDAENVLASSAIARDDYVVAGLIYTEEESKIINEVYKPILNYVEECWALFVTGEMDIDAQWDEYIKTINEMGLQDAIDATQSCYDRMNG